MTIISKETANPNLWVERFLVYIWPTVHFHPKRPSSMCIGDVQIQYVLNDIVYKVTHI